MNMRRYLFLIILLLLPVFIMWRPVILFAEGANLKSSIIGKWVEQGGNANIEFSKDDTAIIGSETVHYKFIGDNQLQLDFKTGVEIFEVSFDKEGGLNLKDASGVSDRYLIEKVYKELLEKSIKDMVFIKIKGGCFQMGDVFGDGMDSEKPVHEICVDDFYMEEAEITQRQWTAIMGSNPSYFKGCNDCPVEKVSWNDIQKYINKLNQKTGKKYRLPTEAEWEYAARSGGKKEKFAGTSSESELGKYAWYDSNSDGKTHPVKQKKPNGFKLYDISGNVFEWVQDWYDADYYKSSPKNNPNGPLRGGSHALRGGSWFVESGNVGTTVRSGDEASGQYGNFGFRLALPVSGQ